MAGPIQQSITQTVKTSLDVTAAGIAGSTLVGLLPPIAAAFTIVWLAMQMFVYWPKVKERYKEAFKKKEK